MTSSRSKLRIGVVGAGVASRQHLEAYQHNPKAELVAVFDTDLGRVHKAAQDFGIKAVETLDAFAALQLDAVSIGTPHNTHLPIFEKLAPHVAGVLMEKPLEITLERARTIARLAKQHNVKVMMAFVHRFRDEVRAAYDAIQAGEIGKVGNLLESICSKGGNHPPRWVFDPAVSGGGALMYTGVHSLDRLSWLAGGEVERVSAFTRNISSPHNPKIEDSLSAIFEFKNGAIGTLFENAPAHQFPGGWVSEIYGSAGAIRIQQQVNCAIGTGEKHRIVQAGGDRFARTIDHFLSCLLQAKPFEPDLRAGLANAALADAIYRSDTTGHTVKVEGV